MAYDPRVLQMMQMGVNMATPDQPQSQAFMETGGFRGTQPRKRVAEPLHPASQSANSPANSPASLGGIPIGLLQMLMMGGKPIVSGTPRALPTGGAAPAGSYGAIPGAQNNLGSPWGWLGGVGTGGTQR